MGCYQRISIFILVTTMALLQGVNPCDYCDPDVPSRSPPRNFVRSKRATNENCAAGEFFNDTGKFCQECEPGYFMTEKMARERVHYRCESCHVVDEFSSQQLKEPCNRTRDTVFGCKPIYYMKRTTDETSLVCDCVFQCTLCSVCGVGSALDLPYEIEKCNNYTDTVCCEHEDMMVSNGECVNRTTTTQGTTQQRRGDTAETAYTSGPPTTHKKHYRNDFQVMLGYPSLVLTSLLLNFLIRGFSS